MMAASLRRSSTRATDRLFVVRLERDRHLVYAPTRPLAFVANDALSRTLDYKHLPQGNAITAPSTSRLIVDMSQGGATAAYVAAFRLQPRRAFHAANIGPP